jgi:uncharacterized membrane protein
VIREERGTITVFVTVFMVALLMMAGLVFDGGNVLSARREAGNVAESAARAGAQAIDQSSEHAGSGLRLDPTLAERRARAYLTLTGYDGTATASADRVVVRVTITQRLFILGIGGLAHATVTAQGEARVAQGVLTEGD